VDLTAVEERAARAAPEAHAINISVALRIATMDAGETRTDAAVCVGLMPVGWEVTARTPSVPLCARTNAMGWNVAKENVGGRVVNRFRVTVLFRSCKPVYLGCVTRMPVGLVRQAAVWAAPMFGVGDGAALRLRLRTARRGRSPAMDVAGFRRTRRRILEEAKEGSTGAPALAAQRIHRGSIHWSASFRARDRCVMDGSVDRTAVEVCVGSAMKERSVDKACVVNQNWELGNVARMGAGESSNVKQGIAAMGHSTAFHAAQRPAKTLSAAQMPAGVGVALVLTETPASQEPACRNALGSARRVVVSATFSFAATVRG